MITATAAQVLLAGALDLVIGDPRWLPHPVRIIGKAISACEGFLRRICSTHAAQRMAGTLLVAVIVLPVYLLAASLTDLLGSASHPGAVVLGSVILVYLMATTIATRELILSVQRVIASVEQGDLESGRRLVGMIVGRDTKDLNGQGVLKAAIESLAENLSDGVVAPLFYLTIGGLPLALVYKAINTLDSMVGYRNERYRYFGWAAARLDDAANYLPARITGLLIVAAVFLFSLATGMTAAVRESQRSFAVMLRDGRKHPSPNSGVPEAAMAGAVHIRLGGPSIYGGIVVEKPVIGNETAVEYLAASRTALRLAGISSVMAIALAAGAVAMRGVV